MNAIFPLSNVRNILLSAADQADGTLANKKVVLGVASSIDLVNFIANKPEGV